MGESDSDKKLLPYMPGRLLQHMATWRRTTNDSFVLSVITNGYRIQWNEHGAPPPSHARNSPNCENHSDFIDSSISDTLKMGVVVETSVERRMGPGEVAFSKDL